MTFKDLGLQERILNAIEEEGYKEPTEIQEKAIPYIMEGKDVLGCAQTGTGKTAAFALPIISHLINNRSNGIKVLVLTPTRELAMQIKENFKRYGKYTNLRCCVIFGGVNQRSQVEILRKGVDILIATPGRVLDLINQRYVKTNDIDILVLDEADTMLDMGFIHDVTKIISYIPTNRQTLMFSATMNDSVMKLAKNFLRNYIPVKVNTNSITVEKINQTLYFVDKNNKSNLLLDLLKEDEIKSVLVFTRTKHGANKLTEILSKNNISVDAIHGNKSQGARVRALTNFKNGNTKVLVATDVAARGIDICELSHVINYEIPEQPESYVHRIGRTGRAGLSGTAISFCCIDEKKQISDIQKLINQEIEVVNNHNYPMLNNIESKKSSNNRRYSNNRNKGNNRDFNKRKTSH